MSFPAAPPPLPGVVHTDVRVDRARWHVATAGEADAPPIVLLHGWPQNWWIWRRMIPALAKTHRVYAPDLRGFGWSDAPDGRYSKMGLACDVERLFDELAIEQADLVGHDWGGMAAWLTAIRAPERVRTLAVFSIIHPWPALGSDLRTTLRTLYMPVLGTPGLGPSIVRQPAAMRRLIPRAAAPGFRFDPQDLALYADGWARPGHARATSALYRTFITRELAGLLRGRYANRRVTAPTLVATGALDPIVTPERIAGAEDHVDDLRTAVVEGAGHYVADEKPAEMLDLILSVVAL
jgi:pimeloyl-ACP methyl ester carboxylesterase